MPSSLFAEGDAFAEERALRLALELSMMGLGESLPLGAGVGVGVGGVGGAMPPPSPPIQQLPSFCPQPLLDDRQKKSQNMTECVPVPSSEHVAEIVGRQGCKIKALRAKTNTYIKTPVRGEEPVFVVTGRKEDVGRAKREILSAAEHFSQIRASRRSSAGAPPGPPAAAPGHVTTQVRVPYRVVGLVVGPKGATIKRIQQQTHTYIVTPSRDKEPVFEVTGLPESVEAARKEIEAHIAVRTGAGTTGGAVPGGSEESEVLGTLCDFTNSYLGRLDATPAGQSCSSGVFSSSGSVSSGSSGSGSCAPGLASIWSPAERERDRDRDEGLGESPSFENPAGVWAFSSTTRPSPSGSPRGCALCTERAVTAALVPCGHNLFCLECASGLANRSMACPACCTPATTAIRIRS